MKNRARDGSAAKGPINLQTNLPTNLVTNLCTYQAPS